MHGTERLLALISILALLATLSLAQDPKKPNKTQPVAVSSAPTPVTGNGTALAGGFGVFAKGGASSGADGGVGVYSFGGDSSTGTGGIGLSVEGGEGGGAGRFGGVAVVAVAGGGANGANTGSAARFLGDVSVQGRLTKTMGTFKIDHPLDPENNSETMKLLNSCWLAAPISRQSRQRVSAIRLPYPRQRSRAMKRSLANAYRARG